MRLDRVLKGPRRVVIFEGGHTWLPVEAATEGIEWLELQGMASGARPRDQPLIDDLFARRVARAEALTNSLELIANWSRSPGTSAHSRT